MKSPCANTYSVSGKGIFFLCSLFLISWMLSGQIQFHRLYARNDTVGPSDMAGIAELPNGGGYLLTGLILPCFNCTLADALAIKTDLSGDTLWTRRIGGSRADYFSHAIVTHDGNYLFAGTSMSFGPQPMGNFSLFGDYLYLVKLTVNGDTMWSRIYGGANTDYYNGNYLTDIVQTTDSGFVLCMGIRDLTNSGKNDGLVIRLNANGDTLWTRAYGSGNNESLLGIRETADKGFIIAADTGWNQGTYYTSEGMALKIDSVGNIQWQKSYGGIRVDALHSVVTLTSGDYLMAGNSRSFTSDSNKNYIYVLRLNSIGDTVWSRIYGPVFNMRYLNLESDSVALITGLSGTTNYGILALRINVSDGSLLFSKEYGSPGNVSGVATTSDGGFIFGCSSPDFGSSYGEGYVIKVDGSGNSGCYEYAITENILPTQTNVGQGNLKIKPFPVIVQSTNTQISSGLKIGTVCTNASVSSIPVGDRITIYPNPSEGIFTIDAELIGSGRVTIFNILGEEVSQSVLSNGQLSLDLSNQPAGTYFLHVKCDDGRQTFDKIIIE